MPTLSDVKRRIRPYLTLGNLVLFLALWWAAPTLLPHLGALVGVRSGPEAAPSYAYVSLTGDTLSSEQLRGQVVLVNFWATWCEPCEREMPAMERLWERLPRDAFELVAVSIDDDDAKVVDFVKRYALRFPVVMDRGKQVSVRYQTTGVPESILVDREGHVVERYVGPRDWDAPEYVARIEALIGASSGERSEARP